MHKGFQLFIIMTIRCSVIVSVLSFPILYLTEIWPITGLRMHSLWSQNSVLTARCWTDVLLKDIHLEWVICSQKRENFRMVVEAFHTFVSQQNFSLDSCRNLPVKQNDVLLGVVMLSLLLTFSVSSNPPFAKPLLLISMVLELILSLVYKCQND